MARDPRGPDKGLRRVAMVAATLVVTTLLGACGPEPRDMSELTVTDSLYVDPASGTPFTGPVFRHFEEDSARTQIEGTLREGVWDGELVVYHPNGRVRYMGSFARGERCGPWIENADSTPTLSTYEELVREVESMGLYPPCEGSS